MAAPRRQPPTEYDTNTHGTNGLLIKIPTGSEIRLASFKFDYVIGYKPA